MVIQMYKLIPAICVFCICCLVRADVATAGSFGNGGRGGAPSITGVHVTRIILLGTKGGPAAVASRSEPANLLIVDGTPYLIDVGAGTVRRIAEAGYSPTEIHTIFFTHYHVDHNAGLVSLMSLIWFGRSWLDLRGPPVEIYGPPATRFLVNTALRYLSVSQRIFRAGVPQMQKARSMFFAHDIEKNGMFFDNGQIRVTSVENTHFLEKSYGPTGKRDKSYSYRFDTPAGSVVFTGDTGPSDAVQQLARNADVLVSEACAEDFCGHGRRSAMLAKLTKGMPRKMAAEERYHMLHEHLIPQEVGKMAAAAHVHLVILTHLVYGPGAAKKSQEVPEFTSGVKEFYSGPVIVGRDLFEYDLVKREPAASR